MVEGWGEDSEGVLDVETDMVEATVGVGVEALECCCWCFEV